MGLGLSLSDDIKTTQYVADNACKMYGPMASVEMAENLNQTEFVSQIHSLISLLPQRFTPGKHTLNFSSGESLDVTLGEEGIETISKTLADISLETQYEVVSLFNTIRLANYSIEEMSDPSLCEAAKKEESSAAHLNRVGYLAELMSEEKKQLLFDKGVVINIASHERVMEDMKQVPRISEDIAIKTLIDVKLIDVVDALLSFRSYRAFTPTFIHALHEAVKKVAEFDISGKYTAYVMHRLDFFFKNVDILAHQAGRTKENFIKRRQHESDVVQNIFDISYDQLEELLNNHYGKQTMNAVLQDLILCSGVQLDKGKQHLSLKDKWIQVCTQLGLHLKSNEDIRLMEEEDFVVDNSLSSEIYSKIKHFSYDQLLVFFQEYEEKIKAEGRDDRDQFKLSLSEYEEKVVYNVLSLCSSNKTPPTPPAPPAAPALRFATA